MKKVILREKELKTYWEQVLLIIVIKMNLENNLHNTLEFSTRRKRGLVQTRYMCIGHGLYRDDEEIPRFPGSVSKFSYPSNEENSLNNPWKLPNPWKIVINSAPAPVLKPIELPKPLPLIRDFTHSGFQFHMHENPIGLITGGKIKPYGTDKDAEYPLTGYQSAMGDLYSRLLNIKKIEPEDN
jgi:hypothetical protein